MGVERRARGFRIFRDQFEIAERGHERDHERNHKRQPHDAAHLLRNLARERVDAGAENIADDEQQKQPGAHDPMKTRFDAARLRTGVHWDIGHRTSSFVFAVTSLQSIGS